MKRENTQRDPTQSTQYIDAQPTTNTPLTSNNPKMKVGKVKKASNTTGVPISNKVDDDLVPTSAKNVNLLMSEFNIDEGKYDSPMTDFKQHLEEEARLEDLQRASEQLFILTKDDKFFDADNLVPTANDTNLYPKTTLQKDRKNDVSHIDLHTGRRMRHNNNDEIVGEIDGLSLADLPDGNELAGRATNYAMDSFYNYADANLGNIITSTIVNAHQLMRESSWYSKNPKDLDLRDDKGRKKIPEEESSADDDGNVGGNGGINVGGNGGVNFSGMNNRRVNKNFKFSKYGNNNYGSNNIFGTSLNDLRSKEIPVKIQSRTYKSNNVNLVRRSNQTQGLNDTEFEP